MISQIGIRILFIFIFAWSSVAGADGRVISWRCPEAIEMLARSDIKSSFFILANHYTSQSNRLLCGPTSAIIVLNALRVERGAAPLNNSAFVNSYRHYLPEDFEPRCQMYTLETFFTEEVEAIKTMAQIHGEPIEGEHRYGVELRELHHMLIAHGVESKMTVVEDDLSSDSVRLEMMNALENEKTFLIINYSRQVLGQEGTGHVSPVAAYDRASDSFLVLDVNPNTAPWVWVKADRLIEAMRTLDRIENRGYLVVREPNE